MTNIPKDRRAARLGRICLVIGLAAILCMSLAERYETVSRSFVSLAP